MKVILTGSDGFIGKRLKQKLEQVWEVVEVEQNDCWMFLDHFTEWDDVECIFHMGAISDTTASDPVNINYYNVTFTLSLFQIAIAKGIPVKYASSASVYGNGVSQFNPLNFYALSKLTVDYWVQDHIDEFKFVQGFRFFNVYGDGEEDKLKRNQASPVTKFIHQAKTEGKITIFEDSDEYMRDFVCVDDVVEIVIGNSKPSGVYDLGTGMPISFGRVAELVSKTYDVPIVEIPFPDHLRGKYQTFTCAWVTWPQKFISVKSYVENSLG
jgi:ADP-L-glycero-D-manno-heptose 6-epimerase